MAVVRRFTYSN